MENKINYIVKLPVVFTNATLRFPKGNLCFEDCITGKEPTKRQLEVLLLLNPFVKKTNYTEIAKILGISKAGVQQRMCHLKKRCPSIYKKFWDLKKSMSKGQQAINKAYIADPVFIEELNALNAIRETF